jgi:hypothetical protein
VSLDRDMQSRIWTWCGETFEGLIDWRSRQERCFRFLEEALELVQALDVPKAEAQRMLDYVYSRPAGEPAQELGGVAITLMSLAEREGLGLAEAARAEFDRILDPEAQAKIRAKQATKKAARL